MPARARLAKHFDAGPQSARAGEYPRTGWLAPGVRALIAPGLPRSRGPRVNPFVRVAQLPYTPAARLADTGRPVGRPWSCLVYISAPLSAPASLLAVAGRRGLLPRRRSAHRSPRLPALRSHCARPLVLAALRLMFWLLLFILLLLSLLACLCACLCACACSLIYVPALPAILNFILYTLVADRPKIGPAACYPRRLSRRGPHLSPPACALSARGTSRARNTVALRKRGRFLPRPSPLGVSGIGACGARARLPLSPCPACMFPAAFIGRRRIPFTPPAYGRGPFKVAGLTAGRRKAYYFC